MLIAVANGVSKGLALAFMALAARLLSLEEFGQLAVVKALGALLGSCVATGLPQALMWGLGRASGRTRGAISANEESDERERDEKADDKEADDKEAGDEKAGKERTGESGRHGSGPDQLRRDEYDSESEIESDPEPRSEPESEPEHGSVADGVIAEQESYLASAIVGMTLLAGIVVLLLGLVVATGVATGQGWGWLPLLAAAVIGADCIHFLYLNLLQGRLRPAKIAVYSILRNGLKVSLLGGVALLIGLGGETANPGVVGVVFCFAIAPMSALVAVELWRPEGLLLRKEAVNRHGMRVMARYGVPIILSSLAYVLITSGDLLLVSHYHNDDETALYSASKYLMIAVLLLPVAARNLLIPTVAAEAHSRRGLYNIWAVVWGLAAAAAIIIALGGPTLAKLVFGDRFKVDELVMTLLPIAALAHGLTALLGAYWLGKGKPGVVAVVDWLAAGVAVTTYLWLIPDMGSRGAAWGFLGGTLTGAALLVLLSCLRVRLGPEFLDRLSLTRGAGMAGLNEADR